MISGPRRWSWVRRRPARRQFDYPVLGNSLYEYKFKVITGYESTPKKFIWRWSAARCTARSPTGRRSRRSPPAGSRRRRSSLIAQWALREHAELQEVPLVLDLARTEAPTGRRLQLALARLEFGRPFFLPPNVPPARVEAIRRAFDATMKDPAYLARRTSSRSRSTRSPVSRSRRWSRRSRARRPTPSPACAPRWRIDN